jgi:hypothetical protein
MEGMNMGTIIGLLFLCVILGALWWAISTKLWPMISPYIGEPFRTFIVILMVFFLVVVVLYAIAQMLGMAGVHVAIPWIR